MDHLLVARLRNRREVLRQIVQEKKAAVKKAPAGTLKFARRKNRTEYYWMNPKVGKYEYIVKDNWGFAAALAQKCYDEKVLKAARMELKLINKLIRMYEPDGVDAAYEKSPLERKRLIHPVWQSDEEFREEWLKQESCTLGFNEDDPEYYTEKGERVRSKSEIFIANTMYHHGVDYLFECKLLLRGYGTIRPDFFVLDLRNRRTIVWEHLGKLGDPEYVDDNLRRINAYLKNGYIIGETLILTFESDKQPINTLEIEKIVRHYFL